MGSGVKGGKTERPEQAGDPPAKGAARRGLSPSLAEGNSRPFVYIDAETQ